MKWTDVASVELPSGMQLADLLTVIDQIVVQVKAALAKPSKKGDDGVPHVEALVPVVKRAFDRLVSRREVLRELESKRQPDEPAKTAEEEHTSDVTLDDAWKGVERVTDAGTKLTDGVSPGRVEAERLHAKVFGKAGLKFTNLRPRRQWDASCERMAIVTAPDAVATLDAIGGARYLAALRKAHHEFGITFGFLKHTIPNEEAVTDTREEQLAAHHALRDFVLRVSANADEEDSESVAFARFVLKPYAELVDDLSRDARKPAKADDATKDAKKDATKTG